jgi:transglutaminase-like putative cysteine protease
MFWFRERQSAPKEFEYSPTIRYLVLAAMMTPLLALVRVRGTLLVPVSIAALGICLGHWYSYTHLGKPQQVVKVVMFVAIHIAFAWMCAGLFVGTAVPQAQFAVLAQAITSFDLRYRRSLFNTLLHSLANFYVAATLSRTVELAFYLILFAVLVLLAFYAAGKEDGLKRAKLYPRSGQRAARQAGSVTLFGFSFGLVAVLAVVVAYLFTPRFANRPIIPPFSLDIPLNGGVKAEIINPGVPLVQINGWNDGQSDYFYGFDSHLDLRYRGGLSDAVVMYVRSPSRSYWRSHSYDFYTGSGWQQSNTSVRPIVNDGGEIYYRLPYVPGSPLASDRARPLAEPGAGEQIVQTYTIVREQPNLIFAAYRPVEVFLFTDNLSIDSGDGLRTPEPLKVGMTYSVVSHRPDFNPDLLRQASTDYPRSIGDRYRQLPDNITGRTRQLARRLTAGHDNVFDQVMALTDHLLATYPYNFYPPPHPDGAEVVDTFLFEDREGVCEQYVTALVVMARSLGIPARLAAGYGAGQFNQLTGYYEVRASDAHSWAEVYFPGYGWVPFDPTPGWTPQPYPTPVQTWFLSRYGGAFLELDLPLAAMLSAGLAGLGSVVPLLVVLVALVGLVAAFLLGKRLRLRLAGPAWRGYSSLKGDRTRRLILSLYRRAERLLLRRRYRPREAWETAGEYAASMDNLAALDALTRAVEAAAYRPEPPDEAAVAAARAALRALGREVWYTDDTD